MNSKQEEQVEQEHLSREHMSKMIRAQTVVMKQVHEDNLTLQKENAELREALHSIKDKINDATSINEMEAFIYMICDASLNKNDN